MSNLSHIGSVGFTTKYITTGNIKGIQANPVVQYLLNSTFGRDKAHIGFLGAQTEVGLYINERTDNIVQFNHGTKVFAGMDFALHKSPSYKVGTKLQLSGQYNLFNGKSDKQFDLTETVQNSYYVKGKDVGANLDLNYKYINRGNYLDKMKINSGQNYAGAGLQLLYKPENTNIELFAGTNVEFPIKKQIASSEIEGDVNVGIKVFF